MREDSVLPTSTANTFVPNLDSSKVLNWGGLFKTGNKSLAAKITTKSPPKPSPVENTSGGPDLGPNLVAMNPIEKVVAWVGPPSTTYHAIQIGTESAKAL